MFLYENIKNPRKITVGRFLISYLVPEISTFKEVASKNWLIILEFWKTLAKDVEFVASPAMLANRQIVTVYISYNSLRWSETKNLKISNPDNIFFLYLIIIKLCTLKHLENIHQKLKLKFS